MATIKDVAKLAGVSTATVSHVINKTRFVSQKITASVCTAIDKLQYSPSAVARSLKLNHTKTIGLLVRSSNSPYFLEVIQSVENSCYQHGYTLILCHCQNNFDKQKSYLTMLMQKRVDGLLVMCCEYSTEFLEYLKNYHQIPIMIMDLGKQSEVSDYIQDNAFKGGYLATRYLIERGHHDIGSITGKLNEHTGRERNSGFFYAMKEAKLTIRSDWIIEGNFQPESGYQAMKELIKNKARPSAIFCGGDVIAMGAICAAQELGLQVPHDISVIGYDNIEHARFFNPALTTIHQPKDEFGQIAFTMLLDRIVSKRNESRTIALKPRLIKRHSVTDGPFKG